MCPTSLHSSCHFLPGRACISNAKDSVFCRCSNVASEGMRQEVN
jgi:hypothetical protein